MEKVVLSNEKKVDISLTNKFNLKVVIIETLMLILGYIEGYIRGVYELSYTASIIILALIIFLSSIYIYSKNKYSTNLKYTVFGTFIVMYTYILFTSDSPIIFAYIIPTIIVSILYFDYNYIKTTNAIVIIVNFIEIIYNFIAFKDTKFNLTYSVTQILVIILTCYAVLSASKLAYFFNEQTGQVIKKQKNDLENVLKDVLKIAASIRNNASKVNYIVDELTSSTNSVATAMENISQANHSDADDIQKQTMMTEKIQDSISHTVTMSKKMVEVAESSSETVLNGLNLVNDLKSQSESIVTTNKNLVDSMKSLQDRTKKVQNIATIIFEISNQTNLLALNASIESARAGEAGKGFAVVANEIRKLSEQTREATENISSIINELDQTAAAASEAVMLSIKSTKEQNKLITSTEANFSNINKQNGILTDNITAIDKKISELLESNNSIVDSITRLSASSEEVTASVDEATSLSEQSLANVDFVKNLINELEKTSQRFDSYIEK